MAKDRFELNPTKPNSVRAFTLEGTVELETADSKSARALLDVLNSFVSDIAIYRQSRSMHKAPELALLLVGMGVLAFWLYI
jgi:hypothetical protein